MFGYEVALHCLGQPIRTGDAGAALRRSVGLNFENVTLVAGKVGRHLVKLILRVLGKDRRTGTELDRHRVLFRVGIESVYGGVDLADFGGCLTGNCVGLLRLSSGRSRYLVGRVGRSLSLVDACLSAAVDILDVLRVLGVDFIQLVQLTLDRVQPLVYPLLAGKRIHLTPEPLLRWLVHALSTGGGLRRRRRGVTGAVGGLLRSR